jgi:tRNA-Thr(GGU) m(6)t(6)A37 methyltransferase TsaA
MTDLSPLTLTPIGVFHSPQKHKYEAPSQPHLDTGQQPSRIELFSGRNFESALTGLEGMSHIWVIFGFNRNSEWKPITRVPRGPKESVGVFASRSPYRPNPIGLSLLKIVKIKGLNIFVEATDILDHSPVLDIKPFHPQADVPQSPQCGWIEHLEQAGFEVTEGLEFKTRAKFLASHGVSQIASFCQQQLRYRPLEKKQKRLSQITEKSAVLAYRTWRIPFEINGTAIELKNIHSGYSAQDLSDLADPWSDKDLHRAFMAQFESLSL